jgi:type IV secretory pathway TrbD component
MMEQEPEGFRVPVHRSLTEPLMMGGIPRHIALLNGFATFSLVMGAHNLWVLPLGLITHYVLVMLYKRDKHILAIIKVNLSRPPHLRS